jgi:membrane protease subunit (stomatin/prohibitin family)
MIPVMEIELLEFNKILLGLQIHQWKSTRGLSVSNVTVVGIRYDDSTTELLKTVQRADALAGSRGNSNLQASFADGIQSAGKEGGAAAIMGLGIAGASVGMPSLFQQAAPKTEPTAQTSFDLVTKLEGLRRAHEAGLITKEEFDAAKSKALGL